MNTSHKLLASATIALTSATAAHAVDLTGAGATFPAPVYAKWAEAYKAKTGNTVNYQPIGSGGGIKQITAKTVDFGATDDPMPDNKLKKLGLIQFPAIIGGIVPVMNVPGIKPGEMVLDGNVLAAIFSGKVTKWNDGAIAKLNSGLKLPESAITVVYRSDSSGTTAVFTTYLAEVAPGFKDAVGAGKTVNWPTGVGGKGNAGVAANVSKLENSIGYVEYAFAKQNKLTHTGLINKDGKTVQPDKDTFGAAAADADWSKASGMGISLNNQAGVNAWPITSASFILMYETPEDLARSAEVLKFFRWALTEGQQLAIALDYVPLPKSAVAQIEDRWKGILVGAAAGTVTAKK